MKGATVFLCVLTAVALIFLGVAVLLYTSGDWIPTRGIGSW